MEQIAAVLKQAELGVPVAEVIRKVGISEQTFYRWKKQFIGMGLDQATDEQMIDDRTTTRELQNFFRSTSCNIVLSSVRSATSCAGLFVPGFPS